MHLYLYLFVPVILSTYNMHRWFIKLLHNKKPKEKTIKVNIIYDARLYYVYLKKTKKKQKPILSKK